LIDKSQGFKKMIQKKVFPLVSLITLFFSFMTVAMDPLANLNPFLSTPENAMPTTPSVFPLLYPTLPAVSPFTVFPAQGYRIPAYPGPLETIAPQTNIEVLVLGQTGSGKSTFLNTMANYFLGGSFGENEFEQRVHVMIPTKYLDQTLITYTSREKNVRDQSTSQTREPHEYSLGVAGRVITFVDTPGMGDTRGILQDEKNIKKIFKDAGQRGKLAGILLFFNGAETRENSSKIYVLNQVKGMIPDAALKNIIIVLTNTHRASCNFPLESIRREFEVSEDRIFYIDNSVMASDPSTWKDPEVAERLSRDWSDSMRTAGSICQKISASSKDLGKEFRRMYELRNTVMQKFHEVRMQFHELQEAQDNIDQFNNILRTANSEAESFKDYAKRATVQTRKFVENSHRHYSTICQKHNETCHDQCLLNETHEVGNKIFTGCYAFEGCESGARCRTCSTGTDDCSYKHHYHARGKFKISEVTLQEKLEKYQNKYNEATNAAQSAQATINTAQDAMTQIQRTVEQFVQDVESKLEELKKICKGYNFVADLNSTINLLEEEVLGYRSIEAVNSANRFISALKIMADRLSEEGFAAGQNDDDISGFGYAVNAGEVKKERKSYLHVKPRLSLSRYKNLTTKK